MSLQYILRVEHPETKCGPFSLTGNPPVDATVNKVEDIIDNPAYPNAKTIPGFVVERHNCAVEYKSQLSGWVGKHWGMLHDAGFRLYLILIPAASLLRCPSGMQVAYRPGDVVESVELEMI